MERFQEDARRSPRRTRAVWLCVTALVLGVGLAPLRRADEFAFLDVDGIDVLTLNPELGSNYSHMYPQPGWRVRGWAFHEEADKVYRNINARLNTKDGWRRMQRPFRGGYDTPPEPQQLMQDDTGASVVVESHPSLGKDVGCAVFVRERTGYRALTDRLDAFRRRLLGL